jgi:hypothetical protein
MAPEMKIGRDPCEFGNGREIRSFRSRFPVLISPDKPIDAISYYADRYLLIGPHIVPYIRHIRIQPGLGG